MIKNLVNQKISVEKFEAICDDGVSLKGILLIPENPKAVIQFNGGTATKKEFYLPFVEYLAQHNYICCLWDYRGSGESAPDNLVTCLYSFKDYGIKDMPTIKNFLTKKYPDKPFLIFGHSVGGQQVGFMNNLEGVKGMVGFAISTGYIPHMPLSYRILAYYFFHFFTPLSIFLTGYLKAKKFGYMEDLPKNIIKEWRDWCSKKDYFFDEKFYGKTIPIGNFKNFHFPIHVFWTPDDDISNEMNTKNFWKHIKSSKEIQFTKLTPSRFSLKSINHFGFFKKSNRDKLWHQALDKLDIFLENG
jgi:predicted alpha/beta hydrolase